MPLGPGCRKCTPYLLPGPSGMPLALRLTEGLGVSRAAPKEECGPDRAKEEPEDDATDCDAEPLAQRVRDWIIVDDGDHGDQKNHGASCGGDAPKPKAKFMAYCGPSLIWRPGWFWTPGEYVRESLIRPGNRD